jgi:hypothetical protein
MRATLILAVVASLAAALPAAADGGHHGRRGHGQPFGKGQMAAAGAAIQNQGGAVNIVQNGNQNGVAVVGQGAGGTTNIAQNGNNNSLTVIQLTVGGRGKARGWRNAY